MIFTTDYKEQDDLILIDKIKQGNKESLAVLVNKHYAYIYNVALKFFNNVADAEDAAQEVTIKLITKIDSFDPNKAQLRTWLYRIVFNHYLNAKKSGPEKILVDGFNTFFGIIDDVPDQLIDTREEEEMKELIEEVQITCMAGMLMCLSREQRMIYIVGDLFEIDHKLAAEIFEITPANFRKKLSRTRKELYNWMNKKCGLVNKENPCRCPKKTKGFVEAGFVNPEQMKWNSNFSKRIQDLSEKKAELMADERDAIYERLYKEHPFKDTKNKSKAILSEILGNKGFSETFELN